jgi:hypothetical protein
MLRSKVYLIRQIQLLLRSKWAHPTAALLALLLLMPVTALAQGAHPLCRSNAERGICFPPPQVRCGQRLRADPLSMQSKVGHKEVELDGRFAAEFGP